MSRLAQGVLLWTIAVAVTIATLNDTILAVVRPTMRIPLLIAAAVLAIIAAVLVFTPAHRTTPDDHPTDATHGHDHDDGHSRIGWFFVIPFVVLPLSLAVPLGAYTAQRDDVGVIIPPPGDPVYPPLPAGDPLPLTMMEFSDRAAYDTAHSLAGRRVELTGFVTPVKQPPSGGGSASAPAWHLTRLVIMCCAADAQTLRVAPQGAVAPLPKNTWVRVVGTWQPGTVTGAARAADIPRLTVESVTRIPAPADPYE